jgi:hypothetical protein
MKFLATQFTAALFAISSISSAAIIARDDLSATPQTQNETVSQYPNSTDIGVLNGTWYLTGVTSNVWEAYQTLSQRMNVQVDCLQVTFNSTSNSTLDAIGSAFLNQTTVGRGLNATAAAAFLLQPPTSDLNVSAHDLSWSAYVSQVFVNKDQWDNITNQGQSDQNATESGSMAVPGTETMQATINTRLIDSNAQPGTNDSTSFDTFFIWGSHAQSTTDRSSKRDDQDDIYGVVLSRNPSVSQDTFNKTLSLMPSAVNNVSIVLLEDSCNKQQ